MGAGATQYDTDYQAVLNYATSQTFVNPSSTQKTRENQLMVGLKEVFGVTNIADAPIAQALFFRTDGSQDFARINWKNPGTRTATLVNSPTFTSLQGFSGNGTSSYIDTNLGTLDLDPDNFTIAVRSFSSGQNAGQLLGARDNSGTNTEALTFVPRNVSDQMAMRAFVSGTITTSSQSDGSNRWVFGRTNTTTVHYGNDGALTSGAQSYDAPESNRNIFLLASNDAGGGAISFSDEGISYFIAFTRKLTDIEVFELDQVLLEYLDLFGVGFSGWTNLDAISSKRFNGLYPILRGDNKYDFFAATIEGDVYFGEQGATINDWTWTQVVTGLTEIQSCKAFYYNSKWHVLTGHKVGGYIRMHVPQGDLDGAYDSYLLKSDVTEIQDIKIQVIDASGLPQFSYSFQGNANGNGGVYWMKFTGADITDSADWTNYEIYQHNAAWWHTEIFQLSGNYYIAYSARTNGANPSEVPGVYLLQLNADRTLVATRTTISNVDANWLHIRLGNYFGNNVNTDIAVETYDDGKIHLFNSQSAWAETTLDLNPSKDIENIINIGDPFGTGRDCLVAAYISDAGRVTYWNGSAWTHDGGTMPGTSTHPYDNEGYLLDIDNSGAVHLIVDNSEDSPLYGHIMRGKFGMLLVARTYW